MTAANRREKPWDYQPCITILLTCGKSSQDTDHVHHCKFLLVTTSWEGQQTTLLSRDKCLQTFGLFKYIRSLSRLCKREVSQESGHKSLSWTGSHTAQGEKGPEFPLFLLGLRGHFCCFHLEKRNFIWGKRKRVNYELEKDSEGEVKKWKKSNNNRSLGRVGWKRRWHRDSCWPDWDLLLRISTVSCWVLEFASAPTKPLINACFTQHPCSWGLGT